MSPDPEPVPLVEDYDFEPPRRPKVNRPRIASGGRVTLPITAEAGSRVEVRAGKRTILTATATGGEQLLSLRAATGRHVYRVVATDDADNVSEVASVAVMADAEAPTLSGLNVRSPSVDDVRGVVSFSTEPAATYTVQLGERVISSGRAQTSSVRVPYRARNGAASLVVTLEDRLGNVRTERRTVRTQVDGLALTVTRKSSSPLRSVFQLTGTSGTSGTLTLPGWGSRQFQLDDGRAELALALPDRAYRGVTARVSDTLGRSGNARLGAFVVDTRPPSLRPLVSATAADRGLISARLVTEAGARVAWTLRDASGAVVRRGKSVAASGEVLVAAKELPEGTYALEATAVDAAGNRNKAGAAVPVAAAPLTPTEWLLGIAILLIMALVVVAALWLLWRRREALRRAGRSRSVARKARREQRRHGRQLAAHRRAVEAYERDQREYLRVDYAWTQTNDSLLALARLVRGEEAAAVVRSFDLANDSVRAKRGEAVYGSFGAQLVEVRRQQGQEIAVVIDRGQAAVTTHRVVFQGAKRREWAYEKLENLDHSRVATLMRVSNRKKVSGLDFAMPERARVLLDMAVADARLTSRQPVVANVERMLHEHARSRRSAPNPPGPPPVAPVTVSSIA